MEGIGFVLTRKEELLAYRAERVLVCCAIQAKACALLLAMKYVMGQGISSCNFFTDCQTVFSSCTALTPPIEVDWKAQKEIYDIWKILKCNPGFGCYFVSRNQNEMADELAKRGRIKGGSFTGFTFPSFSPII